jgi:hypothetical protein
VKRRDSQERDDAIAREQAESRREKLLAELRAREAADRQPPAHPPSEAVPAEPDETEPPAPEQDGADADAEAAG